MRRTEQGRELRKSHLWVTKYERTFASGLDVRRGALDALEPNELLPIVIPQYPPTVHEKWARLTEQLILAFDRGARRKK